VPASDKAVELVAAQGPDMVSLVVGATVLERNVGISRSDA
jgi:hypothetical protein